MLCSKGIPSYFLLLHRRQVGGRVDLTRSFERMGWLQSLTPVSAGVGCIQVWSGILELWNSRVSSVVRSVRPRSACNGQLIVAMSISALGPRHLCRQQYRSLAAPSFAWEGDVESAVNSLRTAKVILTRNWETRTDRHQHCEHWHSQQLGYNH